MPSISFLLAMHGKDEFKLGERKRVDAAKKAAFFTASGWFPMTCDPNNWPSHSTINDMILIEKKYEESLWILRLTNNGIFLKKDDSEEIMLLELICYYLTYTIIYFKGKVPI